MSPVRVTPSRRRDSALHEKLLATTRALKLDKVEIHNPPARASVTTSSTRRHVQKGFGDGCSLRTEVLAPARQASSPFGPNGRGKTTSRIARRDREPGRTAGAAEDGETREARVRDRA